MKYIPLFILALNTTGFAKGIPDLPPDATSTQYRSALIGQLQIMDELNAVVSAGERNLDWLNYINSFRGENKLSFTSKETQRGIPIDQAKEYNAQIVLHDFQSFQSNLPEKMSRILLKGEDFTKEPPLEQEEYLNLGRSLDRIYQTASRWRMMKPWLPSLADRRFMDIRGYYFLSRLPDRKEKFKQIRNLPLEEQKKIKEWLVGICLNQEEEISTCRGAIDQLLKNDSDLESYYQSNFSAGQKIFEGFFQIPEYAARTDFLWENTTTPTLVTPFFDPIREDIRNFVKKNIEEEWQWGNWKLVLPFVTENADHPHIVFEPGATPHVNGLGGSKITMNANQPLTEYDANWTIRHEFGHVLGLPDCYVEYYDSERSVMVTYQVDVENIMCSRRGHVKEVNVTELKRAYQHK